MTSRAGLGPRQETKGDEPSLGAAWVELGLDRRLGFVSQKTEFRFGTVEMTGITIRAATVGDAVSIGALNAEVQGLHAAALPDLFKSPDAVGLAATAPGLIADQRNLVLLAEIGAEAAGYAYAEFIRRSETPHRHAEDIVYLHHLAVSGACRRRGVGTALMAALRARAEERGVTRIALDVWTFNDSARVFFRRQGFMPYNERLWNR